MPETKASVAKSEFRYARFMMRRQDFFEGVGRHKRPDTDPKPCSSRQARDAHPTSRPPDTADTAGPASHPPRQPRPANSKNKAQHSPPRSDSTRSATAPRPAPPRSPFSRPPGTVEPACPHPAPRSRTTDPAAHPPPPQKKRRTANTVRLFLINRSDYSPSAKRL